MHRDLQTLLQQRLEIIADRDFYKRDPDAHLDALKDISEKLQSYTEAYLPEFDGRLRHYLTNSSYQKALEHLQQNL